MATNNQRIIGLINNYLQHMVQYGRGEVSKGNMLVSPPGVGKTQFINTIANLLGLSLITIEAPHIVEEKIINIPFLITKPMNATSQSGIDKVKKVPVRPDDPDKAEKQYDIELADSHLYTQLLRSPSISDSEYIKLVYSDPTAKAIYTGLGGTPEQIPPMIANVRKNFKVILFIDEFFRVPSPTIGAILRSLLNKRIGMHRLPTNVYVTYATNREDIPGAISERQQNQRFSMYRMPPPTKEEWFDWLIGKFEEDYSAIELNPTIINHFRNLLEDADISSSHETPMGDIVRMSPRRWEQLLLYINTAFPIENENDAKALLTNVTINFINYLDGVSHPIAAKVMKAVVKLINDISKIKVTTNSLHTPMEWRHTLKHQLEMKKRLGNDRKYVPVVSGPPGIGKTGNAAAIAEELGLRLIGIDCSELVDAGEIIGIGGPNRNKAGKMEVKFAPSKLFKQINEIIAYEDSKFKENLMSDPELGSAGGIAEYKKFEAARWKYLIFFDEFNRCPPQVMNALRRIILEKNFGDKDPDSNEQLSLPKEAIVMCAINPTGVGTHELTHHMRDVLDIIPSAATWKVQKKFLQHKVVANTLPEVREAVIEAWESVGNHYGVASVEPESKPFYLDCLGTDEGLYVTPNDVSDMYADASYKIQAVINHYTENGKRPLTELTNLSAISNEIKEALYKGFETHLVDIFDNHDVDGDSWLKEFHDWILSPNNKITTELTSTHSRKVNARGDITNMLEEHLTGKNKQALINDQPFITALRGMNHVQAANIISAWITKVLEQEDVALKYLVHGKVNKTTYDVDTNEIRSSNDQVSPVYNLFLNIAIALIANSFTGEVYEGVLLSMDESMDNALSKLKRAKKITLDEYTDIMNTTSKLLGELETYEA